MSSGHGVFQRVTPHTTTPQQQPPPQQHTKREEKMKDETREGEREDERQ